MKLNIELLTRLAERRCELLEEQKEIEEELKENKAVIAEFMEDAGAERVVAEGYVVDYVERSRDTLKVDVLLAKGVPSGVIEEATKTTTWKEVRVRRGKDE